MLDTISNIYHTRPKELSRFIKFSIVGAVGAIIDFALLNFFRGYLGWPLFWANTASVSAADT